MNFLTKKCVSRRRVLQGLGVGVALPFLDAMVPAAAAVQPRPKRFGVIFVPHGERPGFWTPPQVGTNVELNTIMQPLAPYKDQLTVVSQLANPVSGHGVTVASWLSGTIPKKTVAEDVRAGTTVDQLIANHIGQQTVFKSLEVATEDFTGFVGGCDPAYACAYMNTLAWSSATTPLPMEINPRAVFERMFGRPGTTEQRAERLQMGHSILDSVQSDLADFSRGLGSPDRTRLDDYLASVRQTEQRIEKAERSSTGLKVPDAPVGIPEMFADHVGLHFDLLTLAYASDLTRVFTFMMSRDLTQRTYPEIGITEPHHSMSHHGGDEAKKKMLVKLNTWHMGLFAKFLDKLKSTPDGDGSLLDSSMILFGSGMSESNSHERKDLPTLLVGGFGGRGSRHIKMKDETPIANMMLSLAQYYGVEMESMGISTGTVDLVNG
jgi:hypothetical protein